MAEEQAIAPRRVAESRVVMSQQMLPSDANPYGNVHGGAIMKLVDTAAGVAAMRYVRGRAVTARIDSMSFLEPVNVGDLVTLKASVNHAGRTSLEVGVRVEAENLVTGEVRHVSSAYLVFVALDEGGRPRLVPPLVAETEEEQRRLAEALQRRAHRQRGEEQLRAMRHPPRPRSALETWRTSGAAFVVIGHRGAAGHAPENTLAALALGHALGADAVEIDVHLSADGVPVVIHDKTVDRTTNGSGAVAALELATLKSLDASAGQANYAGVKLPTLEEVLRWARGLARLAIELKSPAESELVDKTLALVREFGLLDQVFFISFDHAGLKLVREACPEAVIGALYSAAEDPVAVAMTCGANAVCPRWSSVTRQQVEAAHRAGLAVSVWTANEPADIAAM
ncbi:MAG TPA: glycerophosphodiester phosphodiesterase family protein, partial [Chloroflexota bacterium]|nr:glycerophosphodiester phosphodiesterase family protein [Chloroflexota bacterium]